jgi:hypothetical protein
MYYTYSVKLYITLQIQTVARPARPAPFPLMGLIDLYLSVRVDRAEYH